MTHSILKRLSLFAFLATPVTTPVWAQTAEISGVVSDPSGLPVPYAVVGAQSRETGAARSALSNEEGLYSLPALPPGSYDLTIQAVGFKALHQNGIVLEVDQRANLNFTLPVGSASERVSVEGTALLVNTSDAAVSTVIGNEFVENLPLNGRSFSSLIELAPELVLPPASYYEQGSSA